MSIFLGVQILGGIVDGKHKFCVIEDNGTIYPSAEAAAGKTFDGSYVPFDTIDQAKEYIKAKSGLVVRVKDDG